jgi:polysaccharide biosynthesis transport protein
MLDTKLSQLASLGHAGSAQRDDPPTAVNIADALGVARRQFWVVVTCLVLGLVFGAGAILAFKPNFKATATILIDTRKFQYTAQSAVVGQVSYESAAAVDSQLELLKSENIARAVISKLKLSDDPEFVGRGLGLRSILFGPLFSGGESLTEDERTERAVAEFGKNLAVRRIGNTYAIDIAYESKYASRAAEVANAVADAYIEQQSDSQYNAMRQASEWLEGRIQDLRDRSTAGQQSVVEYKTKHKIVDLGGGRLVNEQRLTELNSQLTGVRTLVAETKAKLNQWDTITRAEGSDPALNASISDLVKSDEAVVRLRARYLELQNREEELAAKYGGEHLVVVNLRKQMRQVRTAIVAEFQKLRTALESDYQLAQQREAAVKSELTEVMSQSDLANRAQVALRQLEISAQTYQGLYDTFLHRYTDALQQEGSPIAEAKVITRASPPSVRNLKKTLLVGAAFPCLGLVFGCGIAFLRELTNRVFWSSRNVESALFVPCLALVPKAAYWKPPQPMQATVAEGPDPQSLIRNGRGISWIVADAPLTRFTEAIRAIKLAVDLNSARMPSKVIGFTSALSNEGKSTVSLAFALHAARTGSRVILIDGDIRNPSLTRSIAPHATMGIMEVISGHAALEDVICKDATTQMEFLPAVLKSALADSYEILASNPMGKLFDDLQKLYEVVVVDLSPLAPIVDVSATTHFVGSYVLVVEWGRTKIDIVKHALQSVPGVHELTLGAVLNKTDLKRVASYDSHLSGYYYNKHNQRYGLSDTY